MRERFAWRDHELVPILERRIVALDAGVVALREDIARTERLISDAMVTRVHRALDDAVLGTTMTAAAQPSPSGFTLEQLQRAIKAIRPAPPEPVWYVEDASWVAGDLARTAFVLRRLTDREYELVHRDDQFARLGRVLEVRLRPRLPRGWLWIDRAGQPRQRVQLAEVVTTMTAIALAGVDEGVGP